MKKQIPEQSGRKLTCHLNVNLTFTTNIESHQASVSSSISIVVSCRDTRMLLCATILRCKQPLITLDQRGRRVIASLVNRCKGETQIKSHLMSLECCVLNRSSHYCFPSSFSYPDFASLSSSVVRNEVFYFSI